MVVSTLATAALLLASPPAPSHTVAGQDSLASPRLLQLTRALAEGRTGALADFWTQLQAQSPLVEPIPGIDTLRTVTFLWRGGDEAEGIILVGPLPPEIRQRPLRRLPRTDLWFLTARLPSRARFSYAFVRAGKKYTDPFNPSVPTVEGESVATMADAPPQPWINPRPGVPAGTVRAESLLSRRLGAQRVVSVYSPAHFEPADPRVGLVIVLDGEDYRRLVPLPTILDNLIAAGRLPPVVAVLVESGNQATRTQELAGDTAFADFLAHELVPWAKRHFHIAPAPSHTLILGASLGGLCAAFTALRHADVFGNVLSQSGAFWYYPGWPATQPPSGGQAWLATQFALAQRVPLRLYLEAGRFETDQPLAILSASRELHEVLVSKGYPVTYVEFAGGHDFVSWRGSIADGLITLLANPSAVE